MKTIHSLKKINRLPLFIIVALLSVSLASSQSLFEENNRNWITKGDATWSFSNKELVGKVSGDGTGFVMTNKSYGDFVLELEFKPDSTINSGVFVRCKNIDISSSDCHEMNIWDLHPNQDNRTGAIVTKAVPIAVVETLDKWNTYKIKNVGERIRVWINGTLTADYTDQDLKEGYVALQAAGQGEIRFRNVKIKPVEAD
ncbi:DUF1080 domain-containing protein [Spongiimicrobium sp. 3-5]|uniref:3-keto-disaccharide hydrolase n=1 Tax=Spongiimicrobium sp. 3-5 TaxID=3332596 RepID=UPI0039811C23